MILGYYVMIVLTGVLLFYLIPQMALLLFIIVSSIGEAMAKFKSDLPKWLLVFFSFYMVL
jgi:hypothetical protein